MIKCAANAFLVTKISFINEIANSAYEATDGSDVLVVLAEWNEFREPDFRRMRALMREAVIFDGRNLFDREQMAAEGFGYYSIGR